MISNDLEDDKDVLIEAVRQNGYALCYASEALRADRDVVLAAVKQNGFALQFASKELKDNFPFLLQALKTNNLVWLYIRDDVRFDSLKRFCDFGLIWEMNGNFDALFKFIDSFESVDKK